MNSLAGAWVVFWCFTAVILYFVTSDTLRDIEEAEAELDISPYVWHIGNLRILHPGFHDSEGS